MAKNMFFGRPLKAATNSKSHSRELYYTWMGVGGGGDKMTNIITFAN